MDIRLPNDLRAALDAYVAAQSERDLAPRAQALSHSYRGGKNSAQAVTASADIAAYLTTRLPATYAAILSALTATRERLVDFAPRNILDAGAGPGTASWAAAQLWNVERITMLDSNAHFRGCAEALARGAGEPVLRDTEILPGDFTTAALSQRFDLVLAGYALTEIADKTLTRAVERLWDHCSGVFVMVEPGTPAGFARIIAARSHLLEKGAVLIAPCPHDKACPMPSPSWCHFAQRLPRSRGHMRAKGASVPFEDEKFSYLAVARDGVALHTPAARIVAKPETTKPGLSLSLCVNGEISTRLVPKRDKQAYRAAAHKRWGETL